MTAPTHHRLSATEAALKIREGIITSVQLIEACLARIDETDGVLKAWAHIDHEHALAQATEMDAIRRSGKALGALHGVPVGLKDIIDTKDLPTERGSPIFNGRQPDKDAAIVERLKESGAVILGKTVTTEFAFMHPSDTRNPANPDHTPGGSSSGSAAAVAACHVPLAIGTQTNGSVIRPASFCGTYAFKPTRGVVSRRGVLQTSQSLDQIGVFARTLEDMALLTDVIGCYDPSDMLSFPRPRPHMLEGCNADVPIEPDLAVFDLPYDDRISDDARAGLDEFIAACPCRVDRIPSPPAFPGLIEAQSTVHLFEINQHLGDVFEKDWDRISPTLQPLLERARAISRAEYNDKLELFAAAADYFDVFFKDYDAVISLSAAGEAPRFGDGTGDPIFCTIWTLAGLPCINLPLLVGDNGLPIGVQLIGAVEQDDRLMRTANWILNTLNSDTTSTQEH